MAINGVWTKIVGVEKAMNTVNSVLKQMEYKTMEGLLVAAEHLYEDMQVTPPLVPVSSEEVKKREKRVAHMEHLNDTWFAKPFNLVKSKPIVEAGFSSPHALWVHEKPITEKFTRFNSGPKFLEMALKRNPIVIQQIVAKHINPDHWTNGKYTPPVK